MVGGERSGAWDQPANSPEQGGGFPQQGQGHGDREGPCFLSTHTNQVLSPQKGLAMLVSTTLPTQDIKFKPVTLGTKHPYCFPLNLP